MHVIANTSAVWRIIVCANNGQCIPFTVNGVQNQRDQICLGLVKFANRAVGFAPGHIEIPENHRIQSIGRTKIGQYIFNVPLRRSIGIDGLLFTVFIQNNIMLVATGGAG